jgi:hypothetical protein
MPDGGRETAAVFGLWETLVLGNIRKKAKIRKRLIKQIKIRKLSGIAGRFDLLDLISCRYW